MSTSYRSPIFDDSIQESINSLWEKVCEARREGQWDWSHYYELEIQQLEESFFQQSRNLRPIPQVPVH